MGVVRCIKDSSRSSQIPGLKTLKVRNMHSSLSSSSRSPPVKTLPGLRAEYDDLPREAVVRFLNTVQGREVKIAEIRHNKDDPVLKNSMLSFTGPPGSGYPNGPGFPMPATYFIHEEHTQTHFVWRFCAGTKTFVLRKMQMADHWSVS